jgi:hypothetical protein
VYDDLTNGTKQCFVCSLKWWWFFYDHIHSAAASPSSDSLPSKAAVLRGFTENMMDVSPPTNGPGVAPCSRCHYSNSLQPNCRVVIRHDVDGPRNCRRVVARLCDNSACKQHCEDKGGCKLHPGRDTSNTHDPNSDNGMHLMPEQITMYTEHNVLLPMPPRTSEQLDAQEQPDFNSALARAYLCWDLPISKQLLYLSLGFYTSHHSFGLNVLYRSNAIAGRVSPTCRKDSTA